MGAERNGYKFVVQKHLGVTCKLNIDPLIYVGPSPIICHKHSMFSYSRYCRWTSAPRVNIEEYVILPNDEPDAPYAPPFPLQTKFSLNPPIEKEVYPDRVNWIVL